jgi:hypothetical protein
MELPIILALNLKSTLFVLGDMPVNGKAGVTLVPQGRRKQDWPCALREQLAIVQQWNIIAAFRWNTRL